MFSVKTCSGTNFLTTSGHDTVEEKAYLIMTMFFENMPAQVPDRKVFVTQLTFNLLPVVVQNVFV